VGTYDIVILFGLDGIMPNAVQYGMRRIWSKIFVPKLRQVGSFSETLS
jgi:hypothetical protein